jgi:hypothetical protein
MKNRAISKFELNVAFGLFAALAVITVVYFAVVVAR